MNHATMRFVPFLKYSKCILMVYIPCPRDATAMFASSHPFPFLKRDRDHPCIRNRAHLRSKSTCKHEVSIYRGHPLASIGESGWLLWCRKVILRSVVSTKGPAKNSRARARHGNDNRGGRVSPDSTRLVLKPLNSMDKLEIVFNYAFAEHPA